jgi:hypothetical protein
MSLIRDLKISSSFNKKLYLKALLLTPPFTQLNTPYPATAYIKGFLNTLNIESRQADLGIEVILALFSTAGFQRLFDSIEVDEHTSDNALRIIGLQRNYIDTIDPVIAFLQDKNPTLAHSICSRNYLPEAERFNELDQLDWAFGTMGIRDKARHLATLYLEDVSDLIAALLDPYFGFSRYAERIAQAATSFDVLYNAMQEELSFTDEILIGILEKKIDTISPDVICLSVPFPGNLYGALRCGQWIKTHHPHIKVLMGGGYPNTELRSISDERFFQFVDFLTLDDGEAPLANLFEYFSGERPLSKLKRTFTIVGGVVQYINGSEFLDVAQRDVGTPDYSDFRLGDYLSVIEIANPMHRLWSDGRWNKLTLAHGCYWGKCSFCDVTLDYIKRYEPITASILVDRMETIIEQTGQHGFHFVDEAAPPALMRDVALEIINRGLTVTWWTNIRFEQSFTADLCRLLSESGCIAVSGGLEVASDRLLSLMQKGVTVAQVARVSRHFTQSDIMVHAYLMYGFPTQTAQETIDALEMVRQLIEVGVIQSGFWHLFTMTAHSPVGLAPADYQVVASGPEQGSFANNDLYHEDPKGTDHELFSAGLKKSLFNYMHGIGLDFDLQDWFEHEVPESTVDVDFIITALESTDDQKLKSHNKCVWLGGIPDLHSTAEDEESAELVFHNKKESWSIELPNELAEWLLSQLKQMNTDYRQLYTIQQLSNSFEAHELGTFDEFYNSEVWDYLKSTGLIIL